MLAAQLTMHIVQRPYTGHKLMHGQRTVRHISYYYQLLAVGNPNRCAILWILPITSEKHTVLPR